MEEIKANTGIKVIFKDMHYTIRSKTCGSHINYETILTLQESEMRHWLQEQRRGAWENEGSQPFETVTRTWVGARQ